MSATGIGLTIGWIGRHTPKGSGAGGRDAAVIDIAQDLLLRNLHRRGALDAVVFKGGTALRKLYAGNQGRFSLDLDFSLADPGAVPDTVVLDLVSQIDGTRIGPFSYGVTVRRGKLVAHRHQPLRNRRHHVGEQAGRLTSRVARPSPARLGADARARHLRRPAAAATTDRSA